MFANERENVQMWRQEERNAVWKIFYLRNQVQETERLQKTPLQQVGGSY